MRINRKGIMGFPMRLSIALLILALAIPTMTYMISDFQNEADSSMTTLEVDKITDGITKAYYSGVGGTFTTDIQIGNNCYITMGGEGSDSYSIGIFQNNSEADRIYLDRPSVKIISNDLKITGNVSLSFECLKLNGEYCVEVSVVD